MFHAGNADPRGWSQALNNSLAFTKNAGAGNVEILDRQSEGWRYIKAD